ncbi:MAG: hypothetical protein GY701_24310 [Sulfitobacter sp.]|nr:hypothetical protein [Sulfitobacter sp.]
MSWRSEAGARRFRNAGDPVSGLDRAARTTPGNKAPLEAHDYSNFAITTSRNARAGAVNIDNSVSITE